MGYADMEKILRNVMRRAIEENEIVGMNLLIEKSGEELLYCQEGMADRESGRKMQRDTIFRLYSMTKPVTAAAAMILMERGLLDLCQPVADFLPGYKEQKIIAKAGECTTARPMLVKDLLNMTSGLVYPDEKTTAGRAAGKVFEEACARLHTENAMTTRYLADRLGQCPLAFSPGTSWAYGTSADVLGAVIEVAAGKRLSEFMEEAIFEPLEMKDTAFWVPKEKRDRLAGVYETVISESGEKSMQPYLKDNMAVSTAMESAPSYEAGGAGLVSTLDDYLKFAGMLLGEGRRGGVQILKPETVRYLRNGRLLRPQQKAFERNTGLEGHSYANLMRVCKDPSRAGMLTRKGEYGWDGWLGMYFANFPKENMVILMGMQKKDAGTFTLTRKLRNVVLSNI